MSGQSENQFVSSLVSSCLALLVATWPSLEGMA
jgi:hypothetical protein